MSTADRDILKWRYVDKAFSQLARRKAPVLSFDVSVDDDGIWTWFRPIRCAAQALIIAMTENLPSDSHLINQAFHEVCKQASSFGYCARFETPRRLHLIRDLTPGGSAG